VIVFVYAFGIVLHKLFLLGGLDKEVRVVDLLGSQGDYLVAYLCRSLGELLDQLASGIVYEFSQFLFAGEVIDIESEDGV
jgi:hypothetical protein